MLRSMRSPDGDHCPPNEGVPLPESGTALVPSRDAVHTRCVSPPVPASNTSKAILLPPGAVAKCIRIDLQPDAHGVTTASMGADRIARKSLPSSAAVQRSYDRSNLVQPKYNREPSVDQVTSKPNVVASTSGCAFAPS